jgi:hypothetical protein
MTANRERFPRPLLAVMAGFALLVLGLPLIFWFRQEYYELCPQCARLRDVQRWLVPFTEAPYYSFTQTQESPLTLKLHEFGYLDEHEHNWLLVEGRGPGDRIIRGEGVHIASGLTTATIAPFVSLLHQHTDPETEAYWFARMTHPQHAAVVRNVADRCSRESFTDATTFRERLTQIAAFEHREMLFRLGPVHEPEIRTPPRLLYQRPPR